MSLALAGACVCLLGAGCAPPGARALLKGEALIEKGKYEAAVERLAYATKLLPQHAEAFNHLGVAHHHLGDAEAAVRSYRRALELDQNLAEARLNLGRLFIEKDAVPAAISELRAYVHLRSEDADGWLELARAQFRAGQTPAAEESFSRVIELRPGSAEAHNALGVIEREKGRPKESATHFIQALEADRQYGPALLNLATLYRQDLDNPKAALGAYRDYLSKEKGGQHAVAVRSVVASLERELAPPPRVETPPPVEPIRDEPATNVVQVAEVTDTEPAPTAPAAQAQTDEGGKVPEAPNVRRSPSGAGTPSTGGELARRAVDTAPEKRTRASKEEENAQDVPRPVRPSEEEAPLQMAEAPSLPEINPAVTDSPAPMEFREFEEPVGAPEPDPMIENADVAEDELSPKRSFLSRLNPVSWFRGGGDEDGEGAKQDSQGVLNQDSRANTVEVAQNTPPMARSIPPVRPVNRAPTPEPAPVFERYAYKVTGTLPSGNRAQAAPMFQRGVTAHKAGRFSEAVEAYRQALRWDPAYFEANFNLGLAAFRLKDYPLSLLAYERALVVDPASTEARYNFALALDRAGYAVDAVEELRRLVGRDPGDVRAHFRLGTILDERLKRPEKAREHYEKVLGLNPGHPQAAAIRYWLSSH